jgi:hypothetical protein
MPVPYSTPVAATICCDLWEKSFYSLNLKQAERFSKNSFFFLVGLGFELRTSF